MNKLISNIKSILNKTNSLIKKSLAAISLAIVAVATIVITFNISNDKASKVEAANSTAWKAENLKLGDVLKVGDTVNVDASTSSIAYKMYFCDGSYPFVTHQLNYSQFSDGDTTYIQSLSYTIQKKETLNWSGASLNYSSNLNKWTVTYVESYDASYGSVSKLTNILLCPLNSLNVNDGENVQLVNPIYNTITSDDGFLNWIAYDLINVKCNKDSYYTACYTNEEIEDIDDLNQNNVYKEKDITSTQWNDIFYTSYDEYSSDYDSSYENGYIYNVYADDDTTKTTLLHKYYLRSYYREYTVYQYNQHEHKYKITRIDENSFKYECETNVGEDVCVASQYPIIISFNNMKCEYTGDPINYSSYYYDEDDVRHNYTDYNYFRYIKTFEGYNSPDRSLADFLDTYLAYDFKSTLYKTSEENVTIGGTEVTEETSSCGYYYLDLSFDFKLYNRSFGYYDYDNDKYVEINSGLVSQNFENIKFSLTITKSYQKDANIQMNSYTYGQTSNPTIQNLIDDTATVKYYYNTENSLTGENVKEWTGSSCNILPGTYYMFAVIGETDNCYETKTSTFKYNSETETYDEGTYDLVQFTVKPATFKDPYTNETLTYNVNGQTFTVKNEIVEGATVVYTYDGNTSNTLPIFTNCGTYELSYKITKEGYNDLTSSKTLTITQCIVTVSNITVKEREYDGTEDCELVFDNVVFTNSNNEVVIDSNLSITADGVLANPCANENAQAILSNLTLCGDNASNYVLASTGNQSYAYGVVARKKLTFSNITAKDKTYDGTNEATLDYSNMVYDTTLSWDEDKDVNCYISGTFESINSDNNINVTIKYVLYGVLVNNYEVSQESQQTTTASITPKEISVVWSDTKAEYDGTSHIPSVVNWEDTLEKEGMPLYTISGEETNAGKYTATVTYNGWIVDGEENKNSNYTISNDTCEFEITKALIYVHNIKVLDKIYDTTNVATLDFTNVELRNSSNKVITLDGLKENLAAKALYESANAGNNIKVTITDYVINGDLANNYQISTNSQNYAYGNISKMTVVVTGLVAQDKVYDGTTNASITYENYNICKNDNGKVELVIDANFENANAGSNVKVTINKFRLAGDDTIAANYEFDYDNSELEYTASITQKPITLIYSTNEYTYDAYEHKVESVDYNKDDLVSGDTLEITRDDVKETNAGSYDLNITLSNSNYIVANPCQLVINKVSANDIVINHDLANVVYGTELATTYKVLVVKTDVTNLNLDYTATYTTYSDLACTNKVNDGLPTNVGNYYIKASFAESTNLNSKDIILPLTISKKDATISYSDLSVIYDSNSHKPTITLEGILNNDVTASFKEKEVKDANTYTFNTILSGCVENYNITGNMQTELVIGQKEITIVVNSLSKHINQADPELTYTVNGLCDNDKLEVTITRTSGETAGKYAIDCNYVENTNYTVSNVTDNAYLTIEDHTYGEAKTVSQATSTSEEIVSRSCTNESCDEVIYQTKSLSQSDDLIASTSVSKDSNYNYVSINNSTNSLKNSAFTQDEVNNGSNFRVWVEVEEKTASSMNQADKAKIEAKASSIIDDVSTLSFVELTMYKSVTINGNTVTEKVLESNGDSFKMSINLPENLISSGRTYKMLRLHDGNVDVLDTVFDSSNNTITFETNRFSSYAISYTDPVATPFKLNVTALVLSIILLIIVLYLLGYFLLYRPHKLDNNGLRYIYSLPQSAKNYVVQEPQVLVQEPIVKDNVRDYHEFRKNFDYQVANYQRPEEYDGEDKLLVVGCVFENGKVYYFEPNGYDLMQGDAVTVHTLNSKRSAIVVCEPIYIKPDFEKGQKLVIDVEARDVYNLRSEQYLDQTPLPIKEESVEPVLEEAAPQVEESIQEEPVVEEKAVETVESQVQETISEPVEEVVEPQEEPEVEEVVVPVVNENDSKYQAFKKNFDYQVEHYQTPVEETSEDKLLVVGCIFEQGRVYYFEPNGFDVHKGDAVEVSTLDSTRTAIVVSDVVYIKPDFEKGQKLITKVLDKDVFNLNPTREEPIVLEPYQEPQVEEPQVEEPQVQEEIHEETVSQEVVQDESQQVTEVVEPQETETLEVTEVQEEVVESQTQESVEQQASVEPSKKEIDPKYAKLKKNYDYNKESFNLPLDYQGEDKLKVCGCIFENGKVYYFEQGDFELTSGDIVKVHTLDSERVAAVVCANINIKPDFEKGQKTIVEIVEKDGLND